MEQARTLNFRPARLQKRRAAEYLDMSVRRLEQLIRERRLPHHRDGNRVYLMTRDLDAYAEAVNRANGVEAI